MKQHGVEGEEDAVRVEIVDGCIAKVYLNRPYAMNSINVKMRERLEEELKRLATDDSIRVVIITGAETPGKRRAFSSGDDLRDPGLNYESPSVQLDYYKAVDKMMNLYNLIDSYPKPVIAMVNGISIGGGVELALSCDFIFACESAVFGFPEINLGFIPGWGGTQRLARRIGEANAKMLIFTGEMFNAKKAKEIGVVDVLTSDDKLEEATLSFARKIAEKSPLVLLMAKHAIEKGLECSLQSGLFYEVLSLMLSLKTEDMKEGVFAFLEKRKPVFKGR
ncbi:MAG: enoyl-CoA hydratase/isomerase family protein [Candidatus Freyarchaeota archaeon]